MHPNYLFIFRCKAWTYTSAVELLFQTFTSTDLLPEDSFSCSRFPYKSRLALASQGGGKGFNFTLLSKNHHPYSSYLTPLALWRTDSHAHTVWIKSLQIQLTWCEGELENRCSRSDLQKPFHSFHCLTFPFIHSNPLRMELKAVVNDWVPLHGLEGSSFWSQECDWGRRGGWRSRRSHLHFSSSDPWVKSQTRHKKDEWMRHEEKNICMHAQTDLKYWHFDYDSQKKRRAIYRSALFA